MRVKCQSFYSGKGPKRTRRNEPCTAMATYLCIAPGAPRVVCGNHARQFTQNVLIPLDLLDPDIDVEKFPDINGFLDSLQRINGLEVFYRAVRHPPGVEIIIKLGGKQDGGERTR
jgi:hypothetical protein